MNETVERPKNFRLAPRQPAASHEEERLHRKQRLAATFRILGATEAPGPLRACSWSVFCSDPRRLRLT